jgi:hypothetical protein
MHHTCSAKYLQNVQHADINKTAFFRIIYFGALDDDDMIKKFKQY